MNKETDNNQETETVQPTEQPGHFLLILLDEEKYFIPLPLISKIIKPLEIFPLPDTLDFITGVSNFSGEIVPMVDLKKALKLPDLSRSDAQRFLICHYREMKVGFIIDGVIDSWEIDASTFKTDTNRVQESDFISAEYIHHKGNEVIGVIDLPKFIDTYKES